MAAGGDPSVTLQEEATCSICLDYFQEPVMIAECGHNFCRDCITLHQKNGSGPDGSQCPQCRRTFTQDRLLPNRPLKNMVATIRKLSQLSLSSSRGAPRGVSAPPDPTARPPKLDLPNQGAGGNFYKAGGALAHSLPALPPQFPPPPPLNPSPQPVFMTGFRVLSPPRLRHPRDPGLQQGAAFAPEGSPGRHAHRTPTAAGSVLGPASRVGKSWQSAGNQPGFYAQPPFLSNMPVAYVQPPGRAHQTASSGHKSKSKWKDENVLLDPETAHPRYIVSDDQKSVCWADVRQNFFFSNSKRFEYARCVLGTKGFASGKHRWTVDVGDGDWAVGVAQESVNRDEELDFEPDEGIWAIARYGDEYKALTWPRTSLDLDEDPTEIRVCLNYGAGSVAFYDAEDNTRLYSFNSVDFEGEKVFPFFRITDSSATLQLCS